MIIELFSITLSPLRLPSLFIIQTEEDLMLIPEEQENPAVTLKMSENQIPQQQELESSENKENRENKGKKA